jgi:hypothetical protein
VFSSHASKSKPGETESKAAATKSKPGATKSKSFSFRESSLINALSPIPAAKSLAERYRGVPGVDWSWFRKK